MAIVVCKGTKLQHSISSVLTDLAQIIGMDLPEAETETFESDTLDNSDAGIPYTPTGRSEGGSMSCELFLDPALAGHQELTDDIADPANRLPKDMKIIFANAGATEWPFSAAGVGLGGTVALADGLKANASFKLSKIPTYP